MAEILDSIKSITRWLKKGNGIIFLSEDDLAQALDMMSMSAYKAGVKAGLAENGDAFSTIAAIVQQEGGTYVLTKESAVGLTNKVLESSDDADGNMVIVLKDSTRSCSNCGNMRCSVKSEDGKLLCSPDNQSGWEPTITIIDEPADIPGATLILPE